MPETTDRRYGIAEVSRITNVPAHMLRQWESRFSQLKPKRDRANRRYYTALDIEIVRRIKQLLRHEGMTRNGAARALARELYGQGAPKTRQEIIDLIDKVEKEIRAMLDLLNGD